MSEVAAIGYDEWDTLWTHIGFPGNARPTASYRTAPLLHHPNETMVRASVRACVPGTRVPVQQCLNCSEGVRWVCATHVEGRGHSELRVARVVGVAVTVRRWMASTVYLSPLTC